MNEFVLANGDKRWLLGLDHIPTKLLDLYEVNKILAHQPWLITKHHIEVPIAKEFILLVPAAAAAAARWREFH